MLSNLPTRDAPLQRITVQGLTRAWGIQAHLVWGYACKSSARKAEGLGPIREGILVQYYSVQHLILPPNLRPSSP